MINEGINHKQDLNEFTTYTIFAKEGERRGGKSYSTEKTFVLLAGRVKITLDLGDRDESLEIMPGELIHIEPEIPHLFYFPEDTEMLERFQKDTVIKKDERLNAMKGGTPPEMKTDLDEWVEG